MAHKITVDVSLRVEMLVHDEDLLTESIELAEGALRTNYRLTLDPNCDHQMMMKLLTTKISTVKTYTAGHVSDDYGDGDALK